MCDLCNQHTQEEIDEAYERLLRCLAELRDTPGLPSVVSLALAHATPFRGVEGIHNAVLGIRVPMGNNRHLVGFTTGYLLAETPAAIKSSVVDRIREHAQDD